MRGHKKMCKPLSIPNRGLQQPTKVNTLKACTLRCSSNDFCVLLFFLSMLQFRLGLSKENVRASMKHACKVTNLFQNTKEYPKKIVFRYMEPSAWSQEATERN